MKQHMFELQSDQLKLQAESLPKDNPARADYAKLIEDYQHQIERYAQERKVIEAKAKDLEQLRDDAKRHNKPFGLAVMFLQVAILLSSIAGLLKIPKVWWSALPVGLIGVFFFLDGFFVFI